MAKQQNTGKRWTEEELLLTFRLYLEIPFGRCNRTSPEVVTLANLIQRTPSAIAMRLVNFAACDPYHKARGVKGLTGGISICQPIWDNFAQNKAELYYHSERILAEKKGQSIEEAHSKLLGNLSQLEGETKERMVNTRVNQYVFRKIVLSNYHQKCAITQIDVPQLLVASHIIPWSDDKDERLNPSNGICLSSLYDKAFDTGLLTFDADYKVVLSKQLRLNLQKEYYAHFFRSIEDQRLILPEKFTPKQEFLQWHREKIFEKG